MLYDAAIIGCGVIGSSLAYTLSKYDLNILVLEQENDIAMGTTKANSAIVHAGYDPKAGTLLAQLNVRGSEMMEELCQKLSVKYKRIGSFVLAFNESDLKHLNILYDNGVKNGVPDLKIISGDEARHMDPNISDEVCGALYAPSAAITDPWGLCIAETETAVRNGVTVKCSSKVSKIDQKPDHLTVYTTSGNYDARYLINCAGCWAHEISAMVGPQEWEAHPSRGEYYLLDKSCGSLVNHVIFQCPTAAGKGVLVAPTVHGNLIVGPSAEEVPSPYSRENTRFGLDKVAAASTKSVKGLDFRQSIRNFAGVRAETSEKDFIIRVSSNCPRLLHIGGIKSPGLSAAPAIAEYALALLNKMGLPLVPKKNWDGTRKHIYFKELSAKEKAELIAKDPRYGLVICRCETITEGEIIDAVNSPIQPCSLDGIKRRAGSGMGRCQGGFCGPRVLDILSRELRKSPLDILQDGEGTKILISETKGDAKP